MSPQKNLTPKPPSKHNLAQLSTNLHDSAQFYIILAQFLNNRQQTALDESNQIQAQKIGFHPFCAQFVFSEVQAKIPLPEP